MHNPHLFPTEPRIGLQLGFRTDPKYKVIRVGKKLILSDFLSIRNETEIGNVSGIRESNPPPRLGNPFLSILTTCNTVKYILFFTLGTILCTTFVDKTLTKNISVIKQHLH